MARISKSRARKSSGYFREVIALVLLATATFLALSVISYDPFDDTLLSVNRSNSTVGNYIGPFGANIAGILIQLFGFTAYLIPLSMFIIGGCMILNIEISAPVTKAIGLFGLLLGTCVAFSYASPQLILADVEHPFPGGGVTGRLVIDYLQPVLSDLGIIILSVAVIVISIVLSVHFSIGNFFTGVWRSFSSAAENMRNRRKPPGKKGKRVKPPKILVKVNLPWRKRVDTNGQDEFNQHVMDISPEEIDSLLPTRKRVHTDEEEDFVPQIRVPRRRKIIQSMSSYGLQAPLDILNEPNRHRSPLDLQRLAEQARIIISRYKEFGVEGDVLQTNPGPVVNTFEFKPAPGIKYNRVVNLSDELCLALKAISVRINRIAGKSTIGIEVPNEAREKIFLREIIESPEFQNSQSPLTLSLGKTIGGDPHVARLDEMPHLLLAGATGMGKSVCINAMICSLLYKNQSDALKFILVDPKQVELSPYSGIPHLLTPVVTSAKRAASALRWACEEMEVRYQKLASQGVRNIRQYNSLVAELLMENQNEETLEELEPMPYIIIVIDELADLMIVSSAAVEESICRLAQKARAVGIHLIIATQRPSVDVLTGTIKANFQCRIGFTTASKVDSRTILDSNGAEGLLGDGDMLYLPPRTSRLIRLHGPMINHKEVKRIVDYFRREDTPEYLYDILERDEEEGTRRTRSLAPEKDSLYDEAVNLVVSSGVASISNLQRKMRLGYARAARIIDMMEEQGIVGPADGSKPREILKKQQM